MQRISWAALGLILLPATSLATPVITSQPFTTAAVGYAWQYDDDGLPEADGAAPLSWSLATAPADMVISNLTGRLFWAPATAGSYPVSLVVTDADGSATQDFAVEAEDAVAPAFAFEPPAPDAVFTTGELVWLSAEDEATFALGQAPVLDALGTPPLFFAADDVFCITVLANGMYAIASPLPGACDVHLYVSNWVGTAEAVFTLDFDPPTDAQQRLVAALTADRTEGAAPLDVHFSGLDSRIPATEAGWQVLLYFAPGDSAASPVSIDTLEFTHA